MVIFAIAHISCNVKLPSKILPARFDRFLCEVKCGNRVHEQKPTIARVVGARSCPVTSVTGLDKEIIKKYTVVEVSIMVKRLKRVRIALNCIRMTELRDVADYMGSHVQCYLPPDTSERAPT